MSALAHQTGSDPVWCMPHAPRVAARARIARALFLRAVRGPPLRVVLPDGASAGGGGPDAPVMTIEREAVFHRLAAGGSSGIGPRSSTSWRPAAAGWRRARAGPTGSTSWPGAPAARCCR